MPPKRPVKGIVFNLAEEIVSKHYGSATWDQLLQKAGLAGAYTSLGNYADEDLMKIVAVAAVALDKSPADIVRWIGCEAIPLLAAKYPQLFKRYTGTRPFVLDLNAIIHPEVRKLYPGANVPEFDFDTSHEGKLIVGYQSARKMCAFAHGLIDGSARYFGDSVEVQHLRCMHKGDPKCLIEISFVRAA